MVCDDELQLGSVMVYLSTDLFFLVGAEENCCEDKLQLGSVMVLPFLFSDMLISWRAGENRLNYEISCCCFRHVYPCEWSKPGAITLASK